LALGVFFSEKYCPNDLGIIKKIAQNAPQEALDSRYFLS
jgi:hypothetical protein